MSKSESLVRVGVVYVVAFAAGGAWLAWGPDTAYLWLDGLIADALATVVVFGASRLHRNSSFYDAYWSVLPPLLMAAWWLELGGASARAWLLLGVIVVWSLRLTGNWIYAYPGLPHEDWRYPSLRARAGRAEAAADLLGIHLFPTVQVFAAMLPVYVVLTHPGRGLGWLDCLAAAVGLGAVALSFTADWQMYRFVARRRPGQAMEQGLWSWSRHPNYFGEFAFWCALALFGLAAAPATWWWVGVGALGMFVMFQAASIPMMETRSLERRPGYRDVIDRVPRFVPRPPGIRTPFSTGRARR
ncbi:DUF1295 domain-containing protein [Nocardia sp. NPDC127579]|uniref:DUF1295 domain-containing protein n=1 Tax=Nocardia sp. NPDC127579 TaxID=3345402 RepID=UPI00363A3830